MTDPRAGDWAAVAGDEELSGVWTTPDTVDMPHLEAVRHVLEAATRDGVTGPLKAGGVTWTYRPFDAAPLPDSPAPSLRPYLALVGIGLALAGVVLWRLRWFVYWIRWMRWARLPEFEVLSIRQRVELAWRWSAEA